MKLHIFHSFSLFFHNFPIIINCSIFCRCTRKLCKTLTKANLIIDFHFVFHYFPPISMISRSFLFSSSPDLYSHYPPHPHQLYLAPSAASDWPAAGPAVGLTFSLSDCLAIPSLGFLRTGMTIVRANLLSLLIMGLALGLSASARATTTTRTSGVEALIKVALLLVLWGGDWKSILLGESSDMKLPSFTLLSGSSSTALSTVFGGPEVSEKNNGIFRGLHVSSVQSLKRIDFYNYFDLQ